MTDWKIQRLGNFLEYADYRTLPVNSNTELTFKQSLMNGGTEYVQQQPIKQRISILEELWIMRFPMETR